MTMTTDRIDVNAIVTVLPASAWETLHRGTLMLIDRLQAAESIAPVELNPLYVAIDAPELAWSDEQKGRARADMRQAEQALAHRRPLAAIEALKLLLRRLQREGVREASARRAARARQAANWPNGDPFTESLAV